MNLDIGKVFRRVAQMLLLKGADLDVRGVNGNTPLILAALNGHKAVAEMLLARGADPNARNHDGDTPLNLADLRGHRDIARMVREGAEMARHARPVTRRAPPPLGKGL